MLVCSFVSVFKLLRIDTFLSTFVCIQECDRVLCVSGVSSLGSSSVRSAHLEVVIDLTRFGLRREGHVFTCSLRASGLIVNLSQLVNGESFSFGVVEGGLGVVIILRKLFAVGGLLVDDGFVVKRAEHLVILVVHQKLNWVLVVGEQ